MIYNIYLAEFEGPNISTTWQTCLLFYSLARQMRSPWSTLTNDRHHRED